MKVVKLDLSLVGGCSNILSCWGRAGQESLIQWCGFGRADRLTRSDNSQALIQGFGMAHPSIHPTDKLLEDVKGLVLQIQNSRISMIQGNNSIFERSPRKVSILVV